MFTCTRLIPVLGCALLLFTRVTAGGTSFSYQGRLLDGGVPVNGTVDLSFGLWDALAGPAQIGSTQLLADVPVDDGRFTVRLDFGSGVFDGGGRWLEITVDGTTLAPRQEITAVPYALSMTGQGNSAPGFMSTVSGGQDNTATGTHATVGGGWHNTASGADSTIAGGRFNEATASWSVVGGGLWNSASNSQATVAGGDQNEASGEYSTVAGGSLNHATNIYAAVGGGGGNVAGGWGSTVPGGQSNQAGADYSFAAGFRAKALHPGTFVWADSTNQDFISTGGNQFLIAADGGVAIGTNVPRVNTALTLNRVGTALAIERDVGSYQDTIASFSISSNLGGAGLRITISDDDGQTATDAIFVEDTGRVGIATTGPAFPLEVGTDPSNGNGAHVTAGGMWVNGSDRNSKRGFAPVDAQEILAHVVDLPITTWRYLGEPETTRHIGPVAQDFHAAFDVGDNPRYIGTVDADGVALAAIQALHAMVRAADERIDALADRNRALESRLERLEEELAALAAATKGGAR